MSSGVLPISDLSDEEARDVGTTDHTEVPILGFG
jgi:hypothetical protein